MPLLENQDEVNAQVKVELEQIAEQITQGQQARDVLENVEFMRWFKDSQATLFNVLDTIPLNDSAARQRACDLIYLFRKFEATFRETVEIGEASNERWKEIIDGDKKKGLLGRIFDV